MAPTIMQRLTFATFAITTIAFVIGCSGGENSAQLKKESDSATASTHPGDLDEYRANESGDWSAGSSEDEVFDEGQTDPELTFEDDMADEEPMASGMVVPQPAASVKPKTDRNSASGMASVEKKYQSGVRSGNDARKSASTSRMPASISSSSRPMSSLPRPVQAPAIVEPIQSPPIQSAPIRSEAIEFEVAPEEFEMSEAPTGMPPHLEQLPAGAIHSEEQGFSTVQVFYATDRKRVGPVGAGNKAEVIGNFAIILLPLGLIGLWCRRPKIGILLVAASVICLAVPLMVPREFAPLEMSYNGERGELVRGVCKVTVPDSHERGQVERPSLLRFEIKEDRKKHIVLNSLEEFPVENYYEKLRGTVGQSPDSDLLVFIHGFNVDFESAIRRTAQLSVDLPFRGVPICYSWPSQASLTSYTVDENNAAWTVYNLKQFLLELAERSNAKSINIVAHSMGNRAMTAALSQISLELAPEVQPIFDRVVLAAPDVDADLFRRELAPRLATVGRNVTLYASSDDQALVASKQLHGGYPRAGESGAGLVVTPYVETIDVTGIDLSLLGHSYYGDNQSILRDLFGIVRNRMSASERPTVTAKWRSELPYYVLR